MRPLLPQPQPHPLRSLPAAPSSLQGRFVKAEEGAQILAAAAAAGAPVDGTPLGDDSPSPSPGTSPVPEQQQPCASASAATGMTLYSVA